MLANAYRLVIPEETLERRVRGARFLAPDSPARQSACIALACQSPELAAMLSEDFLWNQQRHSELVREVLVLPHEPHLHQWLRTAPVDWTEDPGDLPHHLVQCLFGKNLLSLWVPCAAAPQQHLALINLQHAAFTRVQMAARRLTITRPLRRADFAPAAEVQAPTPLPVPLTAFDHAASFRDQLVGAARLASIAPESDSVV